MRTQDLRNTAKVVRSVLETRNYARNDDMALYYCVCARLMPEVKHKSFGAVMAHHKEYGLPPFETVRRARQKLQAEAPELRADAMLNEEVY